MIFKLPKDKRTIWLKECQVEVIRKLNRDFSKPWFGWEKDRTVVSYLGNMMYEEVILRMVNGGVGKPSLLQSFRTLDHPLLFCGRVSPEVSFGDTTTTALRRPGSFFGDFS